MKRIAILAALLVAGCATPEVAERYEEKSYVPEELAAALGSEDPTVRLDASKQIEAMEPDARKAALLELSRDDRAPVRLMAVGALGRHHALDAVVIDRLIEVLSLDPDPDVRVAAVSGLAAGDTLEGLRALATALMDDGAVPVVLAAARALDEVTGQGFAASAATRLEDATIAAEEAAMQYEEWLDERASGGAK